jgi:hypothetical protein
MSDIPPDDDGYDPHGAAALFWDVMKEDWDTPLMDEYDTIDA